MAKVLIIDDDPTMASLLKTLLEMDGFEAAITRAWNRIPEVVAEQAPDVVLMDCILPEVDGLAIMNELRASRALTRTSVIMTSGMDMEEQCLAAGADTFLLKPYAPDSLLDMIRERIRSDGA